MNTFPERREAFLTFRKCIYNSKARNWRSIIPSSTRRWPLQMWLRPCQSWRKQPKESTSLKRHFSTRLQSSRWAVNNSPASPKPRNLERVTFSTDWIMLEKSVFAFKDLYADWVTQELQASLMVESWPNGPGRLPPSCNMNYKWEFF